jgi:putative transcriptional regulator
MSLRWLERVGLLVLALVLPATMLHAARTAPADAPQQRASFAGQLLIAAPNMSDPRFRQTVILMVKHDANGAFGLAINRPLGERLLANVMEALGEKDPAATGSVRIFLGGPVQPELAFVIHSADYHASGTIDVDANIAVSGSRDVLRDLAHQQGPKQSLIVFGYAGWGPGQIEGEMAQRAWFTTAADAKLVFDWDRDQLWDEAMKRRTQDL